MSQSVKKMSCKNDARSIVICYNSSTVMKNKENYNTIDDDTLRYYMREPLPYINNIDSDT